VIGALAGVSAIAYAFYCLVAKVIKAEEKTAAQQAYIDALTKAEKEGKKNEEDISNLSRDDFIKRMQK
jgi:hypothetical protein